MKTHSLATLTNSELLTATRTLAARERDATAELIAALSEVDARQLHLGLGYPSMFVYCTACLRLSEHAAYARIQAARAARKYPLILELIADGSVNLTTITLLAGSLTPENHERVLRAAVHKSKREIEAQVAALHPLPPAPSVVRKFPASTPRSPEVIPMSAPERPPDLSRATIPAVPSTSASAMRPATARQAIVVPLSPEAYKLQITISRDAHDRLCRIKDLMRHVVPDGDPAVIVDRALALLLADLERRKLAATGRPRDPRETTPGSRHVPASVKREVWARDGGRCAFVGSEGRCGERGFLEFHHVEPFALGGATTAANLELRCRAHNVFETADLFGGDSSQLTRSGPS